METVTQAERAMFWSLVLLLTMAMLMIAFGGDRASRLVQPTHLKLLRSAYRLQIPHEQIRRFTDLAPYQDRPDPKSLLGCHKVK